MTPEVEDDTHDFMAELIDQFVEADPSMARLLHVRMPVVFPHAMIKPWLNPAIKEADRLQPILDEYPAGEMQDWEVSKDVGTFEIKVRI